MSSNDPQPAATATAAQAIPVEQGFAPVGDIDLAYEAWGPAEAPPVLLVAGLGAQLVAWDDDLCAAIVGRGWRVIRYDNRDVGLSTHLAHLGRPDLAAVLGGAYDTAGYRVADMAHDAAGLLTHLSLDDAHVVGVSMGGMIAQQLAIDHAERVRSLVSVMSTPGPTIAPPTPEAAGLLTPPPVRNAQHAADQAVAGARVSGSPGFPFDEERLRRRTMAAYERSVDPAGVARQLAAVMASGDRTRDLAGVHVPTLVLHGADDPLIPAAGGRATAAAVPGAVLEIIEGMGHEVPVALFERIVGRLDDFWRRADAGSSRCPVACR